MHKAEEKAYGSGSLAQEDDEPSHDLFGFLEKMTQVDTKAQDEDDESDMPTPGNLV